MCLIWFDFYNFVISRMLYKWNHTCDIRGLALFHCLESSKESFKLLLVSVVFIFVVVSLWSSDSLYAVCLTIHPLRNIWVVSTSKYYEEAAKCIHVNVSRWICFNIFWNKCSGMQLFGLCNSHILNFSRNCLKTNNLIFYETF